MAAFPTLDDIFSLDNPPPRLYLRANYLRERRKGNNARAAWRNVLVNALWDTLDYGDKDGRTLVRLRIVPDDADFNNLCGDTFDLKYNPNIRPAKLARELAEFREKVERDGVWGVIGEFRTSAKEPWQHADSCWEFVGDDWKDSGYDVDIKEETLRQLRVAQDDVCPTCRKPRVK